MKLTNTKNLISRKGMTLIELTVVILVLLSLMSVLFIGARAWLRGSDRAAAALIIRNAQQGVRAHSNIMGIETPKSDGTAVDWNSAGGTTLQNAIFGPDKYVETNTEGAPPVHPAANGNTVVTGQDAGGADIEAAEYRFVASDDYEKVPKLGDLYIESSKEPDFFKPNIEAEYRTE